MIYVIIASAFLGGVVLLCRPFRECLLSFLWRLAALFFGLRYRVVGIGIRHVPKEGALLLLGNHVSWLDWFLVQLPLRRRLRFMMEREIYAWRSLNWMFRLGRTIPVSPRAAKTALQEGRRELDAGGALALFPEGRITRSGEIEKFYRGFEIIAERKTDGVIVPFYIGGMYGSRLSRAPRRFTPDKALWRRKIAVVYGRPMPMHSSAAEVRAAVLNLKETLA